MAFKQDLVILDSLEKMYKQSKSLIDSVEVVFGDCTESVVFDGVWSIFDEATDMACLSLNLSKESLCWHIYENEFGANEMQASISCDDALETIYNNESFLNFERKLSE